MIKYLKESQLKVIGEGAYGQYNLIKGSDTGVKIVLNCDFNSREAAYKSDAYKSAKAEFNRLKKLRKKTRLVPKPISMAIVEQDLYGQPIFLVGFVMTHIKGKTVGRSKMSRKDHEQLEAAERTLKRHGIHRNDDHNGNVIKTARGNRFKYVFIDPDALRFKKEVEDAGYSW